MNGSDVRNRLALAWWLVVAAACAGLSMIVASQITSRLDFIIYDAVQGHWVEQVDPSVLVVAIDNRSVQQEGQWPWPRARLAHLVDNIGKAAPKAIGLDILLLDARDPAGDAALARSIGAAKTVYLPLQFDIPGKNGAAFALTPPSEPFARNAAGLGHVNIVPDRDGLIRRTYLSYSDGAKTWPSLTKLMAGGPAPAPAKAAGRADKPATSRNDLFGRDPVLISFAGPSGSFPTVSAADVLSGGVPAEMFHGRRALVGVTASGIGDVYATSAGVDGSLMPGVEIQANLLATLLTHRAVVPADGLTIVLLSILPILMVMAGLRFLPPRWTLLLIAGVVIGVLAISIALLRLGSFWLPPVSALAVIALLYPVWTWRKLALASRYLSQELERSDTGGGLLRQHDDEMAAPADTLDRQIHLLSKAVQRERDLGKFLNDRLTQMPDCVLVTDLEGEVVFANEKAKRLFGDLNGAGDLINADDLLNYLYSLKPDGRVPVRFATIRRMRGIPWHCEAETASGRCFGIRFQPQQNSAQDLVGYVIRIVDNTDAVTTQRQRNDALELLSHDMRAPQTSIISYLDGLPRNEVSSEMANRIRAYANHTLKLADDFVHLARAETIKVRFDHVDLAALTRESAESLWPQASAKQVRFAFDFAEPELWVAGDFSLLSRMLLNLIDNAIKFSPAGATVTLTGRSISRAGRNWAELTVTNQGDAIPAERMRLLYQRFRSTAPAGTYGVGLGLAFIHTVVVRHTGKIGCTSTDGQGTNFTVELPAEVSSGRKEAQPPSE